MISRPPLMYMNHNPNSKFLIVLIALGLLSMAISVWADDKPEDAYQYEWARIDGAGFYGDELSTEIGLCGDAITFESEGTVDGEPKMVMEACMGEKGWMRVD